MKELLLNAQFYLPNDEYVGYNPIKTYHFGDCEDSDEVEVFLAPGDCELPSIIDNLFIFGDCGDIIDI